MVPIHGGFHFIELEEETMLSRVIKVLGSEVFGLAACVARSKEHT